MRVVRSINKAGGSSQEGVLGWEVGERVVMGGEMEEDDASRLECLLAGVNDGWGLLESHMDEYSLTCKEAAQKLRRIWKESGLGEAEQAEELGGITEATSRVWGNAVERAESQVAALRKRLEESVREICEIRAELCMDEVGSRSVESLVGGGASVRDKYNGAKELLEEWKGIREARMAEFARLLDELDRMRARLGMGKSGGGGAQQVRDALHHDVLLLLLLLCMGRMWTGCRVGEEL